MPNPQFSDDKIQQRAYEIYQARGSTPGDPNADWQEAVRQLEQERSAQKWRWSVLPWLNRSLARLEKGVIEPTANWLDKADIFRIVEKVSPIIEAIGVIAGAIIIPVVIWQVGDKEQEAKERQERAIRAQTAVQNYLNQLSDILATGRLKTDEDLQTIIRASTLALLDSPDLQADPGLEDWEKRRNDRKGQTIGYLIETGLVQVERSVLAQSKNQVDNKEPVIDLAGANLSNASLRGADLSFVNLSDVSLNGADLSNASLNGADLSGAFLSDTDLSGADLSGANLSGAFLNNADLGDLLNADLGDLSIGRGFSSANLSGANLSGANLSSANLIGTDFSSANLSGANLRYADLRYANLLAADLRSSIGLITEQLNQATLCNTKLPEGIDLSPNRDCSR